MGSRWVAGQDRLAPGLPSAPFLWNFHMTNTLKNKLVTVTGDSQGIGAAIAQRFATEGAKVVITACTLEAEGKRPGSLKETAERIRARGGECYGAQSDLNDPVDRPRIVPETVWRTWSPKRRWPKQRCSCARARRHSLPVVA